jgi:hypothetical protein
MNRLLNLLIAALLAGAVGSVHAKIPAPPADSAKAEEANKKKAEAAKKDTDALAKAQDRAVEHYKRSKGGMMPAKAEMAAKPKK